MSVSLRLFARGNIIDLQIASGAISTGRSRHNCDLACAASHRGPCQLQKDRRGVKMAYRSCSRETAGRVSKKPLQMSKG